MAEYIHFTEEQKHRANNIDLAEFLRSQGEQLVRSGREWRLKSNNAITVRGSEWYDQYEKRGGGAVGFVREFYGKSYPEAVSMLLGGEQGQREAAPKARVPVAQNKKPFALPEPNGNMRRVFAYLMQQRFIEQEVISHFAHEKKLYECAEFHNAVFVGYDENGVPRHACKKSTLSNIGFRGNVESSEPEYSFHHIGVSDRVYVFEAPIDMLSYISMHKDNWQQHSYIALDGVASIALFHQLLQNDHLQNVVLCLDNDEAGIEARFRIADELRRLDYDSSTLVPRNKDWNEDLKEQNGVTPLPAVPHERMDLYLSSVADVQARYLNNDKELLAQIWDCYKAVRDSTDTAVQRGQLQKLSELLLSAAAKMAMRESRGRDLEECRHTLKTVLQAQYRPHTDRSKLPTKMQDLGDAVDAVMRELKSSPTKSIAEIQAATNTFLQLTDTALRAHTCLELAERKLMQEQFAPAISM